MTNKMKKKQIVFSVPAASGRIRNSYGSRARWTWQWSQTRWTRRKRIIARREPPEWPKCDVDVKPVFQSPSSNAGRSPVDRLAARTTLAPANPANICPSINPLCIHEPPQDENSQHPPEKSNPYPLENWRAREVRVETHGEKRKKNKKHPFVRREKANKRERERERERERK